MRADPLLINYPIRIREVILGILIVLNILFFFRPRFTDEVLAGDVKIDFELDTIEIPPIDLIEQQKPLQPAIPVPQDDEFFEQEGESKMHSEKKGSTYVWIRRFLDQEHKKRLYEAVYESSEWIDYYRPKVSKLINLNTIVVHNLTATAMSLLK